MIPLNTWATQALNKLAEGKKNVSGNKEKAMAPAVAAQLESFCRQDAEFAQAVAQGGTFSDCMREVAKGVGSSISDLDAYKKAARFRILSKQAASGAICELLCHKNAQGLIDCFTYTITEEY